MLWWRKVRNHTHWCPGNMHQDGLSYYVHDVTLRANEEGLTFYLVSDQSEATTVAHYYILTQQGYDNLDYLLFPDAVWPAIGLRPVAVRYDDVLPPYLSQHHYEVLGPSKQLQERLSEIMVGDPTRQACRLKKADARQAAPTYLERDATLRQFLHEDWETKLFPS